MRRRQADRELDEELRAYLDLLIDDKRRAGLPPDEARRAALLEMGGVTQVAENVRDVRPGAWLGQIVRDMRYALRVLRRAPAFTAVAAFTLALGIGANTTIFSVVDAVFLRALPVRDADRLIVVGKASAIDGYTTGAPRSDLLSLPLYRDIRDHNTLVDGLAATGTAGRLDVRIGRSGEVEHPAGRFVSGNYFEVLGVGATRGRLLTTADDGPRAGAPLVVLSDAYRRRRFGDTSNVVGRVIDVDGARLTIIGVAAAGFTGEILERPTDLWMPIAAEPIVLPHNAPIEDRGTSWLVLLGRLRGGVTVARARAGFTTLVRETIMANLGSAGERRRYADSPVIVTSGLRGLSAIRQLYATPLRSLSLGVLLLLVLVCTNIATLLLARGLAREHEMTVRLALGAGRWQLIRQLLAESMVLGVLGCIPGLLLAWWGSRALTVAASAGAPIADSGIDLDVLGFSAGITIFAVLLFGLAPSLRVSRLDVAAGLRARGAIGTGRAGGSSSMPGARDGRMPIGRLLIPIQVSLSLVLLIGAALLTRTLTKLQSSDPGLDRDHLLAMEVDAARRDYHGQSLLTLAHELERRLAEMPGVRAVSYSQNGLFAGHDGSALVSIPGFVGRSSQDSILFYDLVGPDYVRAIGGRLLQGRDIDGSDRRGGPSVTVVNEALAKFYFGTDSVVGRTIYFDEGVPTTIIGVIADVKDHSLVTPPPRRAYAPYDQQVGDDEHATLDFEIRADGNPVALLRGVRDIVAKVDAGLPIVTLQPVAVLMRESIREQRLVAGVAMSFGVLALLLATVGLYGVMTYATGRRTSEFGLRSALGAGRGDVIRLVLGDAAPLVALGIAIGVPASLAAARIMRGQLTGVGAFDVESFIVALTVLSAATLLAALIPAFRATRIPPSLALSQD